MALRITTIIDSLEAPENDGEVLIWPEAGSLAGLAGKNRRLRQSYSLKILDRPLKDWMSESLAGSPVIMVGHQPSFFHPGVLAKNFVADALSIRGGGRPQYLVVDSDASRGVTLNWPELDRGHCSVAAASAVQRHAAAYEQLPPFTAEQWRAFFEQIPTAGPIDSECLALFKKSFISAPVPGDYASRWIAGTSSVEQAHGVAGIEYVCISELFNYQSKGASVIAAAFTSHVLLAASRFAKAYNDSLADYRLRRAILGSRHPIPDLGVGTNKTELPFWVMTGGAPRHRLWAAVNNDRVELFAEDESVGAASCAELTRDPAGALRGLLGAWRIRPRALALTLFARMFLCDLFIHGLGGAKYDQITDEIARSFFKFDAPAYACATATLRLPINADGLSVGNEIDPDYFLRDIRFNPHRYLDEPSLAPLKSQREEAIAAAERLRESAPRERTARREAFSRIRLANAAFLAQAPARVAALQQEWESSRRRRLHNLAANSREWFFAFHSKASLAKLAARVRETIGGN
jgi:hypothetical protein